MRRRDFEARAVSEADRAFMRGLVIHEDAALLALAKPAGLPVQTRNPDDRTLDALLAAFAKSNGKRPRLVHRLDSATSGVIVAGRTRPAAAALSAAFAAREMRKAYLGLVSGEDFPAETGEIDLPLVRRQSRPGLELMAAARPGEAGAQAALTRWRVLGAAGRTRLALLEPVTGRMHQLRAHLSLTGRPILGDPQYGGAAALAGEPASGLMLHALRLSGPHPEGGRFSLYAAPPPAFVATAARAGLDLASALQSA